ncbi:MAG: site-specific integrase, partial [Ktedonobacteraceae bacterium]|nr:site-specific integrase [Ktedonobacteraceae bacterium]
KQSKERKKRKRSVHGGGSVYLRQSEGKERWVAAIKDPETGKRLERYARSQKEAYELLEQMKSEIRQGTLVAGSRQTVEKYLQDWFETIQKQAVRETTYLKQGPILHNDILPAIGHIQLQKLTPQHIQGLYSKKLSEGWKPSSIRNIHKILHKAFSNAVRWKLIPKNVCDLVSLPRQVRHKPQTLTKEQTVRLLKVSQGHPLEPLIILALTTGMRHGEIAALRWRDINFEARCLTVERTVTFISGHGYIEGEPKTEKSRRTIILPRFVLKSLENCRLRQLEMRLKAGSLWQNQDLVFCNATGNYCNPATTSRVFHRLLATTGLPPMRIHDLRHSAATLLIVVMRMPANLVQELLGHDDIETTLGLYTHPDTEMQRSMMDGLDDLFGTDL